MAFFELFKNTLVATNRNRIESAKNVVPILIFITIIVESILKFRTRSATTKTSSMLHLSKYFNTLLIVRLL